MKTLYKYTVICDETTNTQCTIDKNELHAKLILEPILEVEEIVEETINGLLEKELYLKEKKVEN